MAHIEVIAFFDGTLKEHKKQTFERNDFRQKTISVLKHIRMIGTPPPKIWWLPPSGIRTCLRNAMRNLSIQVVSKSNCSRHKWFFFLLMNSFPGTNS